jgi:release factor glutamine methyltransferase
VEETIAGLVGAARQLLRRAGIPPDEADLDARLLAEHVLGWTTERFLTDSNAAAQQAFTARYEALVERRVRREPVAYIVRRQEFWGLDFEVSPAVLIPRPETELVVESAVDLIERSAKASASAKATADRLAERSVSVADVCTGSGCIAVAIAHERSEVRVTATELSATALEIAHRNAVHHQVSDRITFRRADLLGGVDGVFDLIVANPPYVPERDRPTLQPEVRDHEPALALFAGPDGLHVIRRLVADAPDRLRPGGALVFEFGFGQSEAVTELISRTPRLTMVELPRDLQNIPRVAIATRTAD